MTFFECTLFDNLLSSDTWFLSKFPSFSWATAASARLALVWIGQGECAAIEGSSQQQLVLRSTLACPVRESSSCVQILESPPIVLPLVQGGVVVGKVVLICFKVNLR